MSMEEVARHSYELGMALNKVRSPEEIKQGRDHTKIQTFDFDGNLVRSITPNRDL